MKNELWGYHTMRSLHRLIPTFPFVPSLICWQCAGPLYKQGPLQVVVAPLRCVYRVKPSNYQKWTDLAHIDNRLYGSVQLSKEASRSKGREQSSTSNGEIELARRTKRGTCGINLVMHCEYGGGVWFTKKGHTGQICAQNARESHWWGTSSKTVNQHHR